MAVSSSNLIERHKTVNQFRQLEDNLLLGPQPTDRDLQEAKALGVRTVIDLRMPGETPTQNADLAARYDLDYVNIPVDKASLSETQIGELDRVMKERPAPFLIHCASGARAAMLLSLIKARAHNWTAAQTFDEAARIGFDLRSSPEFSAFVVAAVEKR